MLGIIDSKKVMTKKKNVYRFGVVNSAGQHSSAWRLWADRNEIYLGHRGVTQSYKFSFHESGICHAGLTATLRGTLKNDPAWENTSRHFDSWVFPAVIPEREIQCLVELNFPNLHLDIFEVKGREKVSWIHSKDSKCLSIGIFKANIPDSQCINNKSYESEELCRFTLKNGYSVIAIARYLDHPEENENFIQNCMASKPGDKYYGQRPANLGEPELRVIIVHKLKDERRICFEASARKCLKNV